MHPFTQALIEADAQAKPLSTTDQQPQTIAEAETIQFEFIDALGGHGGWKITPWSSPDAMVAAPIPQNWLYRSPVTLQPVAGSRLEVEFALLREEEGWQVCLAFEFLRSRLDQSQKWPALMGRADLLSGGGVVFGTARPLDSVLAGEEQLTLTHGSSAEVTVTTHFDPTTLLAAAEWLEGHAASRRGPLLPGMLVITGARIGPLPIFPGTYKASWAGLDDVELTVPEAL